MKRFFLTSVIIALAIFSLSSNANGEGEAMYSTLGCASCHGQNGQSTDENAPSLAGKEC